MAQWQSNAIVGIMVTKTIDVEARVQEHNDDRAMIVGPSFQYGMLEWPQHTAE
jgi:hypothetical protein